MGTLPNQAHLPKLPDQSKVASYTPGRVSQQLAEDGVHWCGERRDSSGSERTATRSDYHVDDKYKGIQPEHVTYTRLQSTHT